jgi:hypothetical protein
MEYTAQDWQTYQSMSTKPAESKIKPESSAERKEAAMTAFLNI